MIEETVEVAIAHQSNPQHRRQSGEAPAACKPSFVDHNEQISDEGNPDLDLDGVGALTIKVSLLSDKSLSDSNASVHTQCQDSTTYTRGRVFILRYTKASVTAPTDRNTIGMR